MGLGTPVSELGELSGSIWQVRELSDGRVIIAQSGDSPLVVVDSAFRSVKTVGRRGEGPGEYLVPSAIFETGDTIWVVDGSTRRLTSLTKDLKLLASVSLQTIFSREGLAWNIPLGMDAGGRFLVRTQHLHELARFARNQDSDTLYWLDPKSQGATLVARLHQVSPYRVRRIRITNSKDTIASLTIIPFAADDAATLTDDGREVVLRASPYRLEWPRINGKPKTGPTVPYKKVKITAADRAMVESTSSGVRTALEAWFARSPGTKIEWKNTVWPKTKPPFVGPVRATPRGELVVELSRESTELDTPLYDFLSDRTGRRVWQLDLKMRGRLVGIGAKYLYVVRLDEDDIEYLGRYRY